MLSSTALDLPEHRALAHKACLDAGVFPIGMEQLPARDATGIAASLEMVDQADIYIGVYGFRYGWVPDGKDTSITEMEFDRAAVRKAEGKLREIILFTAHKDHAFTANDIEADAGAQERLRRFKARASAGRVRKEFKSAEELHRLVLHALSEFKGRQQLAAGSASESRPAKTTTPNNLPRLQAFFGREEELKTIHEALDPDSRTWGALIDGPGGMGKTSLAVRAAYDCPSALFQRIVFVSVKDCEMDDNGKRPLGNLLVPGFLEILNELARELGHPDIAKSPEDQRIRLLLDALRPAQALLILDNLESLTETERGQLLTFVKDLPPGCKAILTSRKRFGNNADAVPLEKLDQDAALATLADLARRNPLLARTSEAERIALYTQTAGIPLLLRWLAGQLGHGSCRTFAHALAFLRSCPPDNDPLEFTFGDLAKVFEPEQTKVLCALTYFSLPAKVEHIAAVASIGEDLAETALCILANRSLVIPDQEENHYALMPMVAEFLRKHRPKVVKETGDLLETRSYAIIIGNGYENHAGFPALEAAWPSIAPSLSLFLAGPNDRLQIICRALRDYLEFTGRWDERLYLSLEAEKRALSSNDFINAGWRAYNASWIYCLREKAGDVFDCADRAEKHWTAGNAGTREQAAVAQLRGYGMRLCKQYADSIRFYGEAVTLWQSIEPEGVEITIPLNGRGSVCRLAGDIAAAKRDYSDGLRISRICSNPEGIAFFTGNLAELELDCGNWSDAVTLAMEALSSSEKIGRLEIVAANCHRLAKARVRQGKSVEGLPHAQRAVDIYTPLRSPDLEAALATLRECEAALAEGGK